MLVASTIASKSIPPILSNTTVKKLYFPFFSVVISSTIISFIFNASSKTSEILETVKVEHGSKVAAIEAPTKEGYTFKGWQLEGQTYDFEKEVKIKYKLTTYDKIENFKKQIDFINGMLNYLNSQ